jgi:hypothetical protein
MYLTMGHTCGLYNIGVIERDVLENGTDTSGEHKEGYENRGTEDVSQLSRVS